MDDTGVLWGLLEKWAGAQGGSWAYRVLRYASRYVLGRPARYIEFFSDREELDRKFPLSYALRPGNEVYGIWLTGETIFSAHREALRSRVVRQIILPHPDHDSLRRLAESLKPQTPLYDFRQTVLTLTQLAREYDIPVRWWPGGFIGSNIFIGNPQKSDGFATLIVRLPFAEGNRFWAIRIEKAKNETEFLRLWDVFTKLWANSIDPP